MQSTSSFSCSVLNARRFSRYYVISVIIAWCHGQRILGITERIKCFMCFLQNKVLLTKDNLARRDWSGDVSCCFYNQLESVDHLFFRCSIARVIWRFVIAKCLNTCVIPIDINQCWRLLSVYAPQIQNIHIVAVSAICWAI